MGTRAADKPVTDDVRIKEIKELVPPALINKEYPVKPGVALSPLVASWGAFRADTLSLSEIAKHRRQAVTLLDEVKFDL